MIDFKSFLNEETESAINESVADSAVIGKVNTLLYTELERLFLTPQAGFELIRKILFMYGVDMPALFDIDPDGDEVVLDVSVYGESVMGTLLYILYSPTDEGYYEFYAEVTDEAGIEELVKSGTEEEAEEN